LRFILPIMGILGMAKSTSNCSLKESIIQIRTF